MVDGKWNVSQFRAFVFNCEVCYESLDLLMTPIEIHVIALHSHFNLRVWMKELSLVFS